MEHGNGVSSCLEDAALQTSSEGLNPQTSPQDGDGPQSLYKPAINPQIRDIKAGTDGKTGLIYWHPTRATSSRISHLFHCRLILSRSTIWSLLCHNFSDLPYHPCSHVSQCCKKNPIKILVLSSGIQGLYLKYKCKVNEYIQWIYWVLGTLSLALKSWSCCIKPLQ